MKPSTTPLPPRRLNIYARTLILLVGYFAVVMVVFQGATLILGETVQDQMVQNVMRFVLFIAYFLFIAAMTIGLDRRPLRVLQFQFNANAIKGFLVTVTITGAITLGVAALSNWVFPDALGEPREIVPFHLLNGFMAAMFLQGIPEELAFRGYLSQSVQTTPVKTMIFTSVAFMLLHIHFYVAPISLLIAGDPLAGAAFFSGTVQILFPLVFGAFAFVMMYLYRSVWAAVAVHFGIHFFRTIGELLHFADGDMRVLVLDIVFAIVTAVVFYTNREAFKPENNRLVYA